MHHGDAEKTDGSRPARDRFGCEAGHLATSEEITGSESRVHHKVCIDHRLGQVRAPAADQGHVIGISLADGHRRKVIRARTSQESLYDKGAFYVRDFEDDYKADLSAFDFLLIECPKTSLKSVARDCGAGSVAQVAPMVSAADHTLHYIGLALLQCFSHSQRSNQLLIDQLTLATQIHVVSRYFCRSDTEIGRRRLLSRRQEAISKEMLSSDLAGVPMSAVADACGLSPSYFIRAFRETVGLTPHRWLMKLRVERAREQLEKTRKSIAEIAVECGFADQSHMTRTFTNSTGSAPGAWRRQLRPCGFMGMQQS